jgi:hypothetical protein
MKIGIDRGETVEDTWRRAVEFPVLHWTLLPLAVQVATLLMQPPETIAIAESSSGAPVSAAPELLLRQRALCAAWRRGARPPQL